MQKEEQDKIIAAARENNRELVNELLNTVHIALQEKEMDSSLFNGQGNKRPVVE